MASGKFAMTLSEISRGTQIEADSSGALKATSIGYFPDPLLDNQLQPAHPAGPTWMISTKSAHVAEAKAWLSYMMQPENLQWLINNTPDFQTLPFASLNLKAKWDANQAAFFSTYALPKTVVTQDAVTYFNPQWMDIGKDEVAMFTGKMKVADVLKAIDTRRTQQAKTAKDPAWP
jgi:raffinose/stachyose/melibiose transport system substrate-binding protein